MGLTRINSQDIKIPDKQKEQDLRSRLKRKAEDPALWKLRNRRDTLKKYGLTVDEYDLLLKKQNGVCAICGSCNSNSRKSKYLSVDHSHKTNKVRGLLCQKCNVGIGSFNDSLELLEKAKEYLNGTN